VPKDCDHFLFSTEFLDCLQLSGLPPNSLVGTNKQSTIVIILRNLNIVSNGTRFIVQNMYEHSIDLEPKTGQETVQRILLPRINYLTLSANSTHPF